MSDEVTAIDPHAPVHGSTVGPWLILERLDSGTFGVRAQRAGHPEAPPVAMEWVEGLTLYDWFRERPRTSREVLQVLAQLVPPALPTWRSLASAGLVSGMVVALVVLLVVQPSRPEPVPVFDRTAHLATPEELAQFTTDGGAAEEALASVQDVPGAVLPAILSLGRSMPTTPMQGQRRPPCERGETAIHGACWVEVAREKPPCGPTMFDSAGACYKVSTDAPRQPTSGTP